MNDFILSIKPDTELPKSLESALINQTECIEQCTVDLDGFDKTIRELNMKISICKEIGMPIKGLKNILSRTMRKRNVMQRTQDAYKRGFMEIPDLNRAASEFDMDNKEDDRVWWKAVLPANAPLRVFEDLKNAKESGLFDKIVFYDSQKEGDPIVAGRIGDRVFLISNYR